MKEYMDYTNTQMIIVAVECNHSPDNGRLKEYAPFSFHDARCGSITAKGAVTMDDSGKFQKYSTAITYSDVEPEETESFLSKVYGGSVGMMVSNLVGRGALSEQEIQELKAILDAAEKQEESSC